MTTPHFTFSALDEIADYLVSDRDTHRVLDRKFAELGITEPRVEPSEKQEANAFKAKGWQRGVRLLRSWGTSKRDRLCFAREFPEQAQRQQRRVLQLIKALHEPVAYASNAEGFKEFCGGLKPYPPILWCGIPRRRSSSTVSTQHAHCRRHNEGPRQWKTRWLPAGFTMKSVSTAKQSIWTRNYFHAVVEAYKGLAERIREQDRLSPVTAWN